MNQTPVMNKIFSSDEKWGIKTLQLWIKHSQIMNKTLLMNKTFADDEWKKTKEVMNKTFSDEEYDIPEIWIKGTNDDQKALKW